LFLNILPVSSLGRASSICNILGHLNRASLPSKYPCSASIDSALSGEHWTVK